MTLTSESAMCGPHNNKTRLWPQRKATMTTKDEEKAMIGNLVAALPEGYVRSILTDFLPGINSAIDDDLGFVGWRETWDHLKEVRAEIDAISKQRDTVVADLRESSR